jgi:anti-sigma B factor antagonist
MSGCAFSTSGEPGELFSFGCEVTAPHEVTLTLAGELDLATAERAFGYVRDAIDRHRGSIVLDLAAVSFCDARGLDALVRMRRYAERLGRPLSLMSPRPQVEKILRITGLDREFRVDQRDSADCAGRAY